MKLIGLTGGIGMGKSTAATLLRERGFPVLDTDCLARELVEPGQPALGEVAAAFGPGVLEPDGRLNRAALAQVVFADPVARRRLEAILHPRIRAAWQAAADGWRAAGRPLGVVVIPLLFETDAQSHCTATLCVACTERTQRRRLAARHWLPEQIDQRLRAQWPVERKMAAAGYVIWTEGDLDTHARQLERVLG